MSERVDVLALRKRIVSHDRCKPGGLRYVPCNCKRCKADRATLARVGGAS